MPDTPDPWSAYRSLVEDHLDTCADYLGRLRRSLAGEIAPDRHYFADKAHQLHTSARRLDRIVQDVERWLGECAAPVEHHVPDDTPVIAECALPTGHPGPHDDVVLTGSRITGELRDLADTVGRLSEQFAWQAPDVDRDLTGTPGTVANSQDLLDNLATSLDAVGRRTTRLSRAIRTTADHDLRTGNGTRLQPVPPTSEVSASIDL
jgi:hypothetical protein